MEFLCNIGSVSIFPLGNFRTRLPVVFRVLFLRVVKGDCLDYIHIPGSFHEDLHCDSFNVHLCVGFVRYLISF